MCRQDEAGFPQKQLETAFLHSLRLLAQAHYGKEVLNVL